VAGVSRLQGVGGQVAVIAGLRWRVFCNTLRSKGSRFDMVGLVLVGSIFGLFAAGAGLGLGILTYVFARRGDFEILLVPFWLVILFWQFFPVLLSGATTAFEYRQLLRFPLRFPAFFLLTIAYGLFDPSALASLLWLACVTVGLWLARPDLRIVALAVIGAFALMNLLLNRMAFAWLERLLSRRRAREVMVALFLLLMVSFQLFTAVGRRWGRQLMPYLRVAQPALQVLPPHLARKGIDDAARTGGRAAIPPLLWLGVYAVGFGLLLERRLRAQYHGEDLQEFAAAGAAVRPRAAPKVSAQKISAASARAWLPGPLAGLVEKEFRYLLRNTAAGLTLVLPLIIILAISLSWGSARQRPGPISRSPEMMFPGAVAYMFLIVAQYAHNAFAYEGAGIQLLFLAPVRFRDVLLAKNIFTGTLLVIETLLLWPLVSLTIRPPSLLTLAGTFAGVLFAALIHFLVGNWLSLKFPRRFEFGQFKRRASGMTILFGFVLQFALVGMVAAVLLIARGLGRMWLAPLVFAALSVATLQVYWVTLNSYDDLAVRERETLIGQLARPRT
jgi:ABC-2 type transport system permease protein